MHVIFLFSAVLSKIFYIKDVYTLKYKGASRCQTQTIKQVSNIH